MDEETISTCISAIASALASGATSPSLHAVITVNPKSVDVLETAVPMVIVQQFIEDNTEKGMPGNQQMTDLKRKQEAIKAEKKKYEGT